MTVKDNIFFWIGNKAADLSDWAYDQCSEEFLQEVSEEIDEELDRRLMAEGRTKLTIYHVLQGPIHRDEIADDDGIPEHMDWLLEIKCRLWDEPNVVDIPLWFGSLQEARAITDHFHYSIEPKVIYV